MGLGLTQFIPLIAYIVFIVVFFLTLFYKAEIGLYLAILLIPLQNLMDKLVDYPMGKDLFDILILAIIIRTYFFSKNSIKYNNKINKMIILMIPLTYSALWVGTFKMGLSYPVTFDNPQLVTWKNFIILPLLYLLTLYCIDNKKQINIAVMLIIATTFLMNANFYSNARWNDYTHYDKELRQSGTFSYLGPNELAAFFSQITMFIAGLFLMDKLKIRKIAFMLIMIFNLYCIFYLFSRGAYIASFVGFMFLGMVKNRKILLLLIVFIAIWDVVLPTAVVERIKMTTNDDGIDNSSQSRLDMWKQGLEAISVNPISGIGLGGTQYLNIKAGGNDKVRKSLHNGFIEVVVEQGIAGFLFYLYIYYVAFKEGWSLFKESVDSQMKGIGLGFVALLISSLITNMFSATWSYLNVMGYFWIILGLTVKANQLALRNPNSPVYV